MKQALLAVFFASTVLAQTATKSTAAASSAAKSTPPQSNAAKSTAAAKAAPRPAGDLLHPSTLTAIAPASYRVKLATTKGDIVIEVTRAWAPRGADRFYNLVRAGYFTDCAFYRVMPKLHGAVRHQRAAGGEPRVQGREHPGRSAQANRTSAGR